MEKFYYVNVVNNIPMWESSYVYVIANDNNIPPWENFATLM